MRTSIIRILGGVAACGCLLVGRAAQADPIAITNPGFEDFTLLPNQFTTHIFIGVGNEILTGDPVPGWTLTGLGGTWYPLSDSYPAGAPEGHNVAWLDYESIESSVLAQVLSAVLTADTVYTLTVQVGQRRDYPLAGYDVQLLAGGTLLSDGMRTDIPPGEFRTVTVTYTATASDPLLGQALEIRLTSTANRQQVNFDDVRLDASPSGGGSGGLANPEPSALLLLGVGALGFSWYAWRKRRIGDQEAVDHTDHLGVVAGP
jgi:hypothetical protein